MNSERTTSIEFLAQWYQEQCDGSWEHSFGVKLNTLDNPGWALHVNLVETEYEGIALPIALSERSPEDWVSVGIEAGVFKARGGVGNLAEILDLFRAFVLKYRSKNAGLG
jgi:hypothetical protein